MTAGDGLGATLLSGDVDADGYIDLIVGAPGVDSAGADAGVVYGYRGSATGIATPDWTFNGESGGALLGTNSRGIGEPADLDGSGLPDVVLASYHSGKVAIWADPPPGSYAWADAVTLIEESGSTLGSSVYIGDADSDGDADLLLGAYSDSVWATNAGSVWVLLDLLPGTLGRSDMDAELYTPVADSYLGTAVASHEGVLYVVASRVTTSVTHGGTLYALGP